MIYSVISITILLLFIEVFYFKIADKYNIIDKPNERSSHLMVTLRGGGIIFPIAWLIAFIIFYSSFLYFTIGLILVSTISFIDDISPLSSKIRIVIHLIAFSCFFYELHLFDLPFWQISIIYLVTIGCLNAVNFMDGINGMTGMYALSILIPCMFFMTNWTELNQLTIIILSIFIFGFFNFRKRAKCFAGDVGSVSIAFILLFIIVGLMFNKWNLVEKKIEITPSQIEQFQPKYILLFLLYGVDSILTICERLIRKENIFKPHRRHLYQILANEKKIPQLIISIIYATIQFILSIIIFRNKLSLSDCFLIISCSSFFYILLKYCVIKTIKLF